MPPVIEPTVPPHLAASRSPAARVMVATVLDSVPVTRVFAVPENEMAPVRIEVPAPGALVLVSFVMSTVGVVAVDEQITDAALQRYARLAMKNV